MHFADHMYASNLQQGSYMSSGHVPCQLPYRAILRCKNADVEMHVSMCLFLPAVITFKVSRSCGAAGCGSLLLKPPTVSPHVLLWSTVCMKHVVLMCCHPQSTSFATMGTRSQQTCLNKSSTRYVSMGLAGAPSLSLADSEQWCGPLLQQPCMTSLMNMLASHKMLKT